MVRLHSVGLIQTKKKWLQLDHAKSDNQRGPSFSVYNSTRVLAVTVNGLFIILRIRCKNKQFSVDVARSDLDKTPFITMYINLQSQSAMDRARRLHFHPNARESPCSINPLPLHTRPIPHIPTSFPSTSTFPALNNNVMQHPTLINQTKVLTNESFGLSAPTYKTV